MSSFPVIDWSSLDSHLLLNPRMPEREREVVKRWRNDLPGHIWLTTSGTSGSPKLVALGKDAMLASSAAVNRRLQASAEDVWCAVLPYWHVGGLGIEARAYLSRSQVIRAEWNARAFAADPRVTLSSLVPAQVSDLVEARLRAPEQLRAIVVGGGRLRDDLYAAARELGWPVLPSYGMTETCSQVATATLDSPDLLLLDHVEARVAADDLLAFRGPSLLTAYATAEGVWDPKADGWLVTEDVGTLDGALLRVTGRGGSWVKIGGESVDLARLDAIVERVGGRSAAVVAVPDARLGHVIWLAVESGIDGASLEAALAGELYPFERPRKVVSVPAIPRSDLGKLLRKRLLELVSGSVE